MAHDDAKVGPGFAGSEPSPFHDVFDTHRLIIDRGDDQRAYVAHTALFFSPQDRGGCHRVFQSEHHRDRVGAAAEKSDAADGHGDLSLVDVVTTHRRIAVGDGCLELGQRDAVAPQTVGIGPHLIAPHGAAPAANVDNPGHGAEFALHDPVLQCFEIVQCVNFVARRVLGTVQDIAVDFARGRLGRNLRRHVGGQRLRNRSQAIDDFLATRLVGPATAVVPVHFQVAQSVERLAMNRLEPRHAGEGHFEGDRDLSLDLFGRGSGKLRKDLDDRGSRIGIRLDIDVEERERPDDRQSKACQKHDERVIQCPLDQLTNHLTISPRMRGLRRLQFPSHQKKEPRIFGLRIRGSVVPSPQRFVAAAISF